MTVYRVADFLNSGAVIAVIGAEVRRRLTAPGRVLKRAMWQQLLVRKITTLRRQRERLALMPLLAVQGQGSQVCA